MRRAGSDRPFSLRVYHRSHDRIWREPDISNAPNRRTLQANTDTLERAILTMNEARADIRSLEREIVRLYAKKEN